MPLGKVVAYLRRGHRPHWESVIQHSLDVKRSCVEIDPRENARGQKLLSLGHTFANSLEGRMNLRHGDAVFYGIVLVTLLASRLGRIDNTRRKAILKVAALFEQKIRGLATAQRLIDASELLHDIAVDKINSAGECNFVVPNERGCMIENNVDKNDIKAVVKEFMELRLVQD